MSSNKKSDTIIACLFAITVVFVALKMIGDIDWSWWWVFAPLWIPFAMFIIMMLILSILFSTK